MLLHVDSYVIFQVNKSDSNQSTIWTNKPEVFLIAKGRLESFKCRLPNLMRE